MPPRPSPFASLVLRVVAACHLDQNIALAIADESRHVLTNARGQMVSFGLGARLRVKTASAIRPYLLRAASNLSPMLVGEFVVDDIAEMIVGAVRTFGAVAIEIGNRAGDCGSELVNVTILVEWRAFLTYENAGAESGKPPPIPFETEVIVRAT